MGRDPKTRNDVPDDGTLDRALTLVRFLREHCPWDAKQTAESLVPHLLEETHEVVDAIHGGDSPALEGELGDLLLNLAFQIVVAEEDGRMSATSVVDRLEDKMRRRHPHLYGLGDQEPWEKIKARERTGGSGVLDGLPSGLDALTRAYRIQERVSNVGFDWADARGAMGKVAEELREVEEELGGPGNGLKEELGDLLFAVVNLIRLVGHHPTTALSRANQKFERRFAGLEALARSADITLGEASLEELDRLWDRVKADEHETDVRPDTTVEDDS